MTTPIDPRRAAAERMAEAATAFLGGLTVTQRKAAQLPFESDQREVWYYTPNIRPGVPLLEIDAKQSRLAHMLLASGLSTGGYVTAASIIGLENVLHQKERWREAAYAGAPGVTRNRDPQNYYAVVYGQPGAGAWSWSFSGHHVVVTATILDGAVVSPTPAFFGADPADSAGVGPNVLRPLAGEEDLGRELIHLLDTQQRARAIVSPVAPFDMIQSNRPRVEDGALPLPLTSLMGAWMNDAAREATNRFQDQRDALLRSQDWEALRYRAAAPAGIPATALLGGQREALRVLVSQYINRLPDDLAALEAEALPAKVDGLHFAWAGAIEKGPDHGHYYRIQGLGMLIEYDNVQNGANHIHSVWRHPENDFGFGSLAHHYATAHR